MGKKPRQPQVDEVSLPIGVGQPKPVKVTTAGKVMVAEPASGDSSAVESIPGVCGGQACVAGTRIPVYILEEYRRLGASNGQLLDIYPSLAMEDLAAAWKYVRHHRAEIEAQIARH